MTKVRQMEVAAWVRWQKAKETMGETARKFITDERGDTNMISIIIVLCIIVALAIVFRKNIANLVNSMWSKIFSDANSATGAGGSATQFN